MTLTVVCGADPLTYWRAFAGTPEPAPDPRIRLLGFVADVRPLYVEANLVIVPTTVSAGTNVKVLEAMAMQRAVVSTTSGCAGLGLLHGHSVWVADAPEAFAAGIATLIGDPERRAQIAQAAYGHARRNFDWSALGEKQREILRPGLLRAQQIRKQPVRPRHARRQLPEPRIRREDVDSLPVASPQFPALQRLLARIVPDTITVSYLGSHWVAK